MHALAVSPSAILGVLWSPAALGASLLGWWDAERSDLITQASTTVSSWKDVVAGYDAAQATGALKPIYSANSFNGRPGLTFDGVDDCLELLSQPFPSGSSPSELWALVDQASLAADTTVRVAFSYGADTTNDRRGLDRQVDTGVNRIRGVVGSGAAFTIAPNANVDFSGRHVVRLSVGAASARSDLDGVLGADTAATPATGALRVRIGAFSNASSGAFWKGGISAIAVTQSLTAAQAAQLTAYLKSRGGIA